MLRLRCDVKFIRKALLYQLIEIAGSPVTLEELADKLDCGRMTIIRHRNALQKQGYISWDSRPGQKTGGSIYEVTDDAKSYIEENGLW